MPVKKFGVENLPTDSFNRLQSIMQFRPGDYKTEIDIRDKRKSPITFVRTLMTISNRRSGK